MSPQLVLLRTYVLQESGNNQVIFMQLDLASLKSVRSFAETFLKTEPRLDILINNAGEVEEYHFPLKIFQILSYCFYTKIKI